MGDKYKLTYFNLRALGEHIRFMFIYAGVPYEEHTIQWEKWAEYKPKMKYGKVPMLEVNGKELSQSLTIARFLAKKFNQGVQGDDFLAARADEIVDIASELRLEFRNYIVATRQNDQTKMAELKKEFIDNLFPKYFRFLEDLVAETTENFITGGSPVWHDFFLATWTQIWNECVPGTIDGFPALKAQRDAVFNIPVIKEYLKSRAPAPF